jgi:transketolase
MSDLRKPFYKQLIDIAKNDKQVIFLTGDLGYSFYEEFVKECPNQFINAGCIEQSMIGIAAGLARAGKKPIVYSGAIFLLLRAMEQVRDDVAYANLDVKLIGTGASGFLGFTHNFNAKENEDDLLKNLPNIKQVYPENEVELIQALKLTGPIYIRL